MNTKIIKNISTSNVTLLDFQGITLAPNETTDGLQFGEENLRDSVSIAEALLQQTLSISDGYGEFTGMSGLNYVKGVASQVTPDGKMILTASDRPKNTFRYVSAQGDDLVNQLIGEGPALHFDVAANTSQVIDIQFLEDIYIKDGYCKYLQGGSDVSYVSVYAVCPAGIPFPAPTLNGNFDKVGEAWVPNVTNTGAYFILGTETVLHRFVNKHPMPSYNDVAQIQATEPNWIPTPYIMRFEIHNGADATSNLKAWIHFGCYRYKTIS